MQKVKVYRCPTCGKGYKSLQVWGNHMEREHPGTIPEGWSYARYYYYLLTGKDHGTCIMCKANTDWNENSQKYNRFCNDPKCKEMYRDIFKKRMIRAGKIDQMNDPEFQRKMLKSRGISHDYSFPKGTKIEYVGTYEEDFLYMMDHMLHWDETDIMGPSPHNYEYDYFNPEEYTGIELEVSDVPTILVEGKDPNRIFYSSIDMAVKDFDRILGIYKNTINSEKGKFILTVYGTIAIIGTNKGILTPKRITTKRLGTISIDPLNKTWSWKYQEIEKRIYIPDFYIPTLNLEIEIKQSTNMHPKILRVDKVKEAAKDLAMQKQTVTRYLKIMDKDYTQFFKFLFDEKEKSLANPKDVFAENLPGMEQASVTGERFIAYNKVNVEKYKAKSSGFKFGLSHARTGKDIQGRMYLSAEDDLIGYFGVDQTSKYILCFEVNPKYQNAGIGKKMLADAVSNYHAELLTVNKKNVDAIRFYVKCGWKYMPELNAGTDMRTYAYDND